MTTLHDELRTAAKKLRVSIDAMPRSAREGTWETLPTDGNTAYVNARSTWAEHLVSADSMLPVAEHIALTGRPTVGSSLADWLEHTAATLHTGRIHGTELVICEPCCEQLPCQHIRPALAVARAINGTAEPSTA